MLSGTPDTLAKKVIREGKDCHAYDLSRPQKNKKDFCTNEILTHIFYVKIWTFVSTYHIDLQSNQLQLYLIVIV